MEIDQLPFKYPFGIKSLYDTRNSDISKLQTWCLEHCKGAWSIISPKQDSLQCFSPPAVKFAIDGKKFPSSKVDIMRNDIIIFEEEADAMLFKLMWIEKNETEN
jgi:hypothetical protein